MILTSVHNFEKRKKRVRVDPAKENNQLFTHGFIQNATSQITGAITVT